MPIMGNEGLSNNQSNLEQAERQKALEQIKIPRLVLKEPVAIEGTDIFGRLAQVTLS